MIAIRTATTRDDFSRIHSLIGEMSLWDAAMSQAAGFPSAAVHAAYYRDSADDLHALLTAPGAAMLMAHDHDDLLGFLGFDRFDRDTAEVQKFFVTPAARGRGAGRALIEALIPKMAATGYSASCLETATFMTGAIALYGKAGFRTCPPFRAPPPALDGLSVFMRRPLP